MWAQHQESVASPSLPVSRQPRLSGGGLLGAATLTQIFLFSNKPPVGGISPFISNAINDEPSWGKQVENQQCVRGYHPLITVVVSLC